jgi:hypothetical protein
MLTFFTFISNNIKSFFISILLFFNIYLLRKNSELKIIKAKNDKTNEIQKEVINAVEKISNSNDINDNIQRMRRKKL